MNASTRLFAGLTVETPDGSRPLNDDRATALIVIAWNQCQFLRGNKQTDSLYRNALARLTLLYSDAGGFASGLSPETRALVALALGTRSIVDATWLSTDPAVHVLLTPWIGWAESELQSRPPSIVGRQALIALRTDAWKSQVGNDPLSDASEDAFGALSFRPGDAPGWETARITALLATMLGHEDLTSPDKLPEEIVAIQLSMRFLRQLQVRQADGYRVRFMSSAIGGVRRSLTSQMISPEATAMTLLAGVEFLTSLDRLTAQDLSNGSNP
jgi:hypothetical protein